MKRNYHPYIGIAINELNDLLFREQSILNLSEQIKEIECSMDGIRGSAADKAPIKGGGSAYEKSLTDRIVKLDKLKESLLYNKKFVKRVNRALSMLTETERKILWCFYVERPSRHIDYLCETFNVEKSRIYQLLDDALRKYIIIMYGS